MLRIVTVAALVAFVAAPSWAGESIRVSTVGKSADQVRAEVTAAARKLCAREVIDVTFPVQEMDACVRQTVYATLAQSQDPALRLATR